VRAEGGECDAIGPIWVNGRVIEVDGSEGKREDWRRHRRIIPGW
jgi:hypothetical protein